MTQKTGRKRANSQEHMPYAERVAAALAKAESMDDFFGKDGIFARLFADTLESMMEEELTNWPQVLNQLIIRFEDRIEY